MTPIPEDAVRPTPSDQRSTDREFRRITRRLGLSSPATRSWRSGPLDARDVRITPHGDRRSAPTVAVAAGGLVLALLALAHGDTRLAVVIALWGLLGCAFLGSDQARTHVTVTDGGSVCVGNGVLRPVTTVPAIAVARVVLPAPHGGRRASRWRPRRVAGELELHNGDRIPVRALAHDAASAADRDRAVRLGRWTARVCVAAGASLTTTRV